MSLTIPPDSTGQSVYVHLSSSTDGTDKTTFTHSDLTVSYQRDNGALTSVTMNGTLAAINSTHQDGYVKHAGAGNYRICLPDAAFLNSASQLRVYVSATGAVQTSGAAVIRLDSAVSSRSSHSAAQAATATRTELAPELARIDENISAAKTLTAGERTTLYAGIWGAAGRTLTGWGTLVADIRADIERGGGMLAVISSTAATLLSRITGAVALEATAQSTLTAAQSAATEAAMAEDSASLAAVRASQALLDIAALPTAAENAAEVEREDGTLAEVLADLEALALTGPRAVTITFNDAGDEPVPNVAFSVDGIGSGNTGPSGSVTIGLRPGDYTLLASPTNGVLFPAEPFTVAGVARSVTVTGAAPALPAAPSDPDYCTLYIDLEGATGTQTGTLKIVGLPHDFAGGQYMVGSTQTKTVNGSGRITFDPVPQGCKVFYVVGDAGIDGRTITVPAESVYQL